MATPTSSATSASPPMAYLQPATSASPAITDDSDTAEVELRKKAIQKFLARAEISMVTRGLRARLAYASYKASHNICHVPLSDLEAQSLPQATHRAVGTKRKATYHPSNPPTPVGSSGGKALTVSRRGVMAPPLVSASNSRSPYPSPVPGASLANRGANASQSLYASILAPPPAKQARTIHNALDPPLAAPQRQSAPSPRSGRGTATTTTPSGRGGAADGRSPPKSRRDRKPQTSRRSKAIDKGKEKVLVPGEDADIKAAATLTSLLLHSRPSMTGSASSPRSSRSGGSDAGSVHPYSFGQSTRAVPVAASAIPLNEPPPFTMTGNRISTPPLGASQLPQTSTHTTPKASGTPRGRFGDSEAADLMLFLATSPSPARPNSTRDRDAQDSAAFRALGGAAGLRAKPRVLFANAPESGGNRLSHNGDASYSSSLSSIGGQVGDMGDTTATAESGGHDAHAQGGEEDVHADQAAESSTTPTHSVLALSHLLPSLPSPPPAHESRSHSWPPPSSYVSEDSKSSLQAPPTPTNVSFNFNDFINVSPSPAHVERGAGQKGGLRADVGRRLFEEEHHRQPQAGSDDSGGSVGLGAGIDLLQSQ